MTKYPDITVKLVGEDGNAFAIMGRVTRGLRDGLRKEGMSAEKINEEVKAFQKEATAGDYDNLLCVCMNWVDVE